jgi:hypothetical protein
MDPAAKATLKTTQYPRLHLNPGGLIIVATVATDPMLHLEFSGGIGGVGETVCCFGIGDNDMGAE